MPVDLARIPWSSATPLPALKGAARAGDPARERRGAAALRQVDGTIAIASIAGSDTHALPEELGHAAGRADAEQQVPTAALETLDDRGTSGPMSRPMYKYLSCQDAHILTIHK